MDHMGGHFMALAILAALVHRNHSGAGQWVDMSCTEAGLGLAGPQLLDATVNGKVATVPGTIDSNADNVPPMVPHGVYPAAGEDAWVAIACRNDQEWATLANLIGQEWATQRPLARFERRLERRGFIDQSLGEWTMRREASSVQKLLRDCGIPVAKVASPSERIEGDPATARWGLWPVVRHKEMGDVRVDGLPLHLSGTDWSITRGAPCLGEHNRYVYEELLGLPSDEVDALAAANVI
jgi:crotonobetainyl-CoA:carnitine CoA-transferase CaiB-like acyl-CoA transferase